MEITERLPLKPIHWLSQLSYSEFVEQCLNNDKKHTKEECKTKYSILHQFCQTNLKTGGITKRIYSYATGTSGRLFSGGSLQGLPSIIRGLFMRDGVLDMLEKHIPYQRRWSLKDKVTLVDLVAVFVVCQSRLKTPYHI